MLFSEVSNQSVTLKQSLLSSLPKLGVGLLYNPSLPEFLRTHEDAVDFLAIIPDMFQRDRGVGQSPRFLELEAWVEFLDLMLERYTLVGHHVGLSLGTAGTLDKQYLERVVCWEQRCNFAWHSDHLSFAQIRGPYAHDDHNAGLAIPVPYDQDVLDMIAANIIEVQQAVPKPFIIENNVYYVDFPDQDMSEPEFLNGLTRQTGCGLLLDIHNLYANARNHNFQAVEFLDQLDLNNVIEIHIAGGNEFAGMYTDSHSGPCPDPVWELLEVVVPRASNLCAITFEFHESYYPTLKEKGIRSELDRAREIWSRTH